MMLWCGLVLLGSGVEMCLGFLEQFVLGGFEFLYVFFFEDGKYVGEVDVDCFQLVEYCLGIGCSFGDCVVLDYVMISDGVNCFFWYSVYGVWGD